MEKSGFFKALVNSVRYVFYFIVLIIKSIWWIIVGRLKPEFAGPIGIAQVIGQAAQTGFIEFIHFIGIISVNLGLLNLLPIPVLDGGHIVNLLWEGITGKAPSPAFIRITQSIGIAILVFLMLLATKQDLARVFKGITISDLISQYQESP